MQPPNQELIVRDLHDNLWTFRHIYRGQPKRHLLTTGWSLFVGSKRLKSGDSVLFIRDERSQLLLGIRRANCQQAALPSSVLSADSMHIGVLAAAAHAAASCSSFTVYYNPRACPSEFIVPLAKYHKVVFTQVSVGMRFGMMFETEESTKRRYMGTISRISDLDPVRWPNSKWRNLQVGWDEHGYSERRDRVSLWEIDTPESLFVFPTPILKRQCLPGFVVSGAEIGFTNAKPLSQAPEGMSGLHPIGLGSEQLLRMLLTPITPRLDNQLGCNQSIYASVLQRIGVNGLSPTFGPVRSQLQQEAAVTKPVMQQSQPSLKQQQFSPLQSISLQTQKPQLDGGHQVVDIDCVSVTHVKQRDPIIAENLLDNCQDHNKEPNSENLGRRCNSSLSGEMVPEKSDITAGAMKQMKLLDKHDGESPAIPPNHEKHIAPIIEDHGIQVNEKEHPLIVQQQDQPTAAQSTRQETSCLLVNNGLDSLSTHQSYYPSEYLDNDDWMVHSLCYQSLSSPPETTGFLSGSGIGDTPFLSATDYVTSPLVDVSSTVNSEIINPFQTFFSCNPGQRTPEFLPPYVQEFSSTPELNPAREVLGSGIVPSEVAVEEESRLHKVSSSCGKRDLSDDKINQSKTYNNPQFELSNGNMFRSSCVSSTILEGFGIERESSFHVPSDDPFSNFTYNQDIQSQGTSASLGDSQILHVHDIPDSSGGTSSGTMEINEGIFLDGRSTKQVGKQHLRTYTKVQKLGSVGRSIDVTRFKNYHELISAIACMFGLEGQLDDSKGSEWKLVFVDYENDVLLVGDDPWDEFVNCVCCIKILSPSEVQQMSEGGVQLMNRPSCSMPSELI
ncbi:auxin response factor 11 [Iris pallida]|uniref:Auxin response factor n=1 Tax=Iris pallida TaxID=29817 RepID=A0AAX6FZJ7_IRIPA|nr:auxin response factor 11 [Iris pallida]